MGNHYWGRPSARRPEISTWPSHGNTFVGEAVERAKAAGEEKLECYPKSSKIGNAGVRQLASTRLSLVQVGENTVK